MQILTEERLQEIAPSIFTDHPIDSVSDRYTFVPTSKVIKDMANFGWYPVDAQEQKVYSKTKEARQGYQKHIIQFENPDVKSYSSDIVPRLLGTNSHDGLNSFKFQAGLFRFVCWNGLVVADTTYNSFKICHKDYTLSEIEKNIYAYVQDVPDTIKQVERYKSIELSKDEEYAFASEAIDLRWEEDAPVTVDNILNRQRQEDKTQDLWTVFNVVQENIINPNFSSPYSKRRVKKVTGINNQIKINKELWMLMAQWATR